MSETAKAMEKLPFEPRAVALRDGREVTLRAAVPGDAAACLAYLKRRSPEFTDYILTRPEDYEGLDESAEREILAQCQASPGSLMLLALAGDQVVAMLRCGTNDARPRIAHIGSIGMTSTKAYWGSGLGSAMMAALIDWAEANPTLKMLELCVFSDNERAIKLYQGCGFVRSGMTPRRIGLDDGVVRDDVAMYRRVDGTLSDRPRPNDFHQDLGEGVTLRQLRYGDAQQLFELYVRNRERMRPYFRWPLTVKSVGQVRGAIAELYELFDQEQRVNAAMEEGGRLLGLVFMNAHHDIVNRRTALAYWIDSGAEGRGLVTRGCQTLIAYAFEQLEMNRVDITVDVDNARFLAVPQRLGFTHEATLSQWLRMPDGRFVDMANYRLLRQDWLSVKEGQG